MLVQKSLICQNAILPWVKHNFIVIAHRGDHLNAPENTLLAFKKAIKHGADYVEIDLRTTKDSQLIVMHDPSLLRMTSKNIDVNNCRFDSLSTILIQDKLHPEWGAHKIPTFDEVLKLCKGKVNIYIDFKSASVPQVYQKLLAYQMLNHVVVYVNTYNQLFQWKLVAPSVPVVVSIPSSVNSGILLKREFVKFPIDILDGSFQRYTSEIIQTADSLHVPVWADIQGENEEKNWQSAAALGFNGLQTDHVVQLIKFLKKNGYRHRTKRNHSL